MGGGGVYSGETTSIYNIHTTRAPTVNPTSTPMINKMIAMITDTEVDKPEYNI